MATELGYNGGAMDPYVNVLELTLALGDAAVLTWSEADHRFDTTGLSVGTQVRYTLPTPTNGTFALFAGRVEPHGRVVSSRQDSLTHTAVDPMAYLGHNPCAEAHEYYNKLPEGDNLPSQYPQGYTIREIIETEFEAAGVVGDLSSPVLTDVPIGRIDWTTYANTKGDFVPPEVSPRGKTLLSFLREVLEFVPNLTFFYDPTTTDPTTNRDGTLYIVDLDDANLPVVDLVVATGTTDAPPPDPYWNVVDLRLDEDASQSYDRVTVVCGGVFTERFEQLTPAWNTSAALFEVDAATDPLAWVPPVNGETPMGPRERNNYNAGRLYKTQFQIAPLRLKPNPAGSSPTNEVIREQTFMEAYQLWHIKYGNLPYPDGVVGIRAVPHIGKYNTDIDPNTGEVVVPNLEQAEKYPMAAPAAYAGNYVWFASPAIYRINLWYLDSGGNVQSTQRYMLPEHRWLYYTSVEPWTVTAEDGSLNYDRELKIYVPEFIRYVELGNNTSPPTYLVDDEDRAIEFANNILAWAKRVAITGQGTVYLQSLDDLWNGAALQLRPGMKVRIHNYGTPGNTRTLTAVVHRVTYRLMSDPVEAGGVVQAVLEFDAPTGSAERMFRHRFVTTLQQRWNKPEAPTQSGTPKGQTGWPTRGDNAGGQSLFESTPEHEGDGLDGESGVHYQWFRVKSQGSDTLTCRTYNPETDEEGNTDITVAKPFHLRRTPFDNETFTYADGTAISYVYASHRRRTATVGSDQETQVVTPDYFTDEQILAINDSGITGGTGVPDTVWVDINMAGRGWARDPTQ